MEHPFSYSSLRWRVVRLRALDRDRHRCSVPRVLGAAFGPCSGRLEVHHLIPVEEGGAPYELENTLTVCKRHHSRLHALRRFVLRDDPTPVCRHVHRTAEARELCQRRLARQHQIAA